jgi:acyl transferase domain-containing protein/NADPH:quinone reductase-like Zn-dependent oxidoreductase/acyl carrier protein
MLYDVGDGKDRQGWEMIDEPIAIIGMSCRYPQAVGIDALWQLLLDGRDVIAPYPGGRFRDLDAAYEQTAAGSRVLATHLGGFIPDVDRFDASFFGISPREAAFIDPQQRLLMEVSWNALEDAGQVRQSYWRSRTGVFTGLWTTDYENHIFHQPGDPEFYLLTGCGRSTACGRLSFTFGFEGPSVSVDTACSSSMVAIHLACQSLRRDECGMALAGGANVILSTGFTRLFTNASMLSRDGRCKFGDQRADGFVRSEGAGMVVLKRLSDAVAAGDGIYAVICGSSINNDGRSGGLLVTPSREGQQQMLLEAWDRAGITGADLSYIEAHGTGTRVGDPVEVGAICDAIRQAGAGNRVPIGSIKSNIGHTESAAGVAGVIKAALTLHHGEIPASLHHETPNPEIDWSNGPIELVQQRRPLAPRASGGPRVVGASSFGLTGTNSHMVLAEHEPVLQPKAAARDASEKPSHFLLPITAYSSNSLIENARSWVKFLDRDFSASDLTRICYLAGARRTHLPHRYAAVGGDAVELQAELADLIATESEGQPKAGVASDAPVRVVFVASGQGSQWDGMARELLRESPVFREAFTRCDQAIAAETGWRLIERLEGPDAESFLKQIDFIQPALFAMSVALAAVWTDAGVTPGVLVGHSMGEIAAAYLAGALTLEDAAKVICRRSRLMRQLSGSGAMVSVELPASEMARWLEPFAGRVSIAAENSPGTTVVAGESEAVEQLMEWLELKEVFCRQIKVDVASHSLLVDPILPALADELAGIRPQPGNLPFFSTVNGTVTPGVDLGAQYWVRNLRQPVRLAASTAELAREGYTCFIELSPHPVLVPSLEDTLGRLRPGAETNAAIALPSLLRGMPALPALFRSFGRYWIEGGTLDWETLSGHGSEYDPALATHRLNLPEYAFERERFWAEDEESIESVAKADAPRLSPLLLRRTDPAGDPGVSLFTVIADPMALPYLNDHRVGGAIVFPASGHIEAALEAARLLAPEKRAVLQEISFLRALYLSESEPPELQMAIRRVSPRPGSFTFSLMGRLGNGEGEWTEHTRGTIRVESPAESDAPAALSKSGEEPAPATHVRRGTQEEHYRFAGRSGLEYGPAFRLVESFEVSRAAAQAGAPGRATARTWIRFDEDLRRSGYLLHPALLDSCFQAVLHLRPRGAGISNEVYLPLHVNGLRIFGAPSELPAAANAQLVTEAVLMGADAGEATFDVRLEIRTSDGQLLVCVESMTVQRVKSRESEAVADDLYAMDWKPLSAVPSPAWGGGAGRHALIFADGGDDAEKARPSYAVALARQLASSGGRCTLVWRGEVFRRLEGAERRTEIPGAQEYEIPLEDSEALDRLLGLATKAEHVSDVLHLWTLDDAEEDVIEGILRAQETGAKFIPALVQAITRAGWQRPPRLWILTHGTQNLPGHPPSVRLAGSTVWGLGRAVAREHPELAPSLIDLSAWQDGHELQADEIEAVVRLLLQGRDDSSAAEDCVAFRGRLGFSARFVRCPLPVTEEQVRPLAADEAWRVETGHAKGLDQLQLRAIPEMSPQLGEVVIEVAYAALNFIDVTKALGIFPGLDPKVPAQMGGECSGRVVAVGTGVEDLKIGDDVLALTPSFTRAGMLVSLAHVPAALVLPRPEGLSLEQAASLPIAYLTAYYSLIEMARLREGEWVLIHAGAGGVGLAAAQIALAQGARVIATASSPEKYAFLHEWGVEHVLPSRSLDFAEGVLEITCGRGVDVVLNSLAGDFLDASLGVLAPYGRFLELGKRDIYEDRRVGLRVFRNNIAYFAVDLAALVEDKPRFAAEMLATVMESIATGRWAPLPVQAFPATDPAQAFQFMAQGRHIGKLVLQFAGMEDVQVLPPRSGGKETLFRRDATYLLTGGFGGVGAAVAEWMAENGAGHLVLASRRQPGSAEEEILRRIRIKGAAVEHSRTDLHDVAQLRQLIGEVSDAARPVRGVMHMAAVIDDALMTNLTPQRFDAVFEPKIRGTWNLHQATLAIPLDFFVMFSSIASVLPEPGHGSYAAANSFMDAFAGYRRGLGLPGTAINWAGWLGLGLARETGADRTIEAYEAEGFGSFERDEALSVLGQALRAGRAQVLATRIDADKVLATHDGAPPLFREVVALDHAKKSSSAGSEEGGILEELAAATHAEGLLKLEALLRREVSIVLRLAPEKIAANQPFGQLGIDSLMALEFIRRVNRALGMALPATVVFNYPYIHALAVQIAQRLRLNADSPLESESREAEESGLHADDLQYLSESDALQALIDPVEMYPGDLTRGK